MAVELRDVVKCFGSLAAVDNVSLDVRQGEFLSLLGPSGCGKTTTLRMVGGFVEPNQGSILIDGHDVVNLPPEKRNIGMVFQNYALFPHMTVYDNVAYGLRRRQVGKKEIEERVARVLDLVALSGMGKRYPGQLSGGQQQRVALARAVVIEPRVLLLDEPLSNLDAKLRKNMQIELRVLQQRLGITTIYVTHDQEEALTLSDRIVVMNQGKVMQIATPQEVYEKPANSFVVGFIGKVNAFPARVASYDRGSLLATVATEKGLSLQVGCGRALSDGEHLIAAIRPEKIQILADLGEPSPDTLPGAIEHVVYTGSNTTYHIALAGGERITVEEQNLFGPPRHRRGDRIAVRMPASNFYVIPS